MVLAAPEKHRTPLSPPPPPYGEAIFSKSNENEDWQGFLPVKWAVGCQSDPNTCLPILRVDTPLPPTVQKPCPPPQLGGLLWPQVLL
jgi:hypothetical protein